MQLKSCVPLALALAFPKVELYPGNITYRDCSKPCRRILFICLFFPISSFLASPRAGLATTGVPVGWYDSHPTNQSTALCHLFSFPRTPNWQGCFLGTSSLCNSRLCNINVSYLGVFILLVVRHGNFTRQLWPVSPTDKNLCLAVRYAVITFYRRWALAL